MDDRRFLGTEREIPSPEVPEKPVRRRFTAEYKLRIDPGRGGCLHGAWDAGRTAPPRGALLVPPEHVAEAA
jgi:hypothetical protein